MELAASDNPFASPPFATRDEALLPPRLTVRRMLAIAGIGIWGGVTLGMLTNAINGAVSPQFFCEVLRCNDNIWARAVGQGMLEGGVRGLGYALLFILLIATLSNRRCQYRTVVKYALATIGMALVFWLAGGIVAVFGARIPELREWGYFGPDPSWPGASAYTWVRGSILGIVYGTWLAVLLTSATYAIRHRRIDLADMADEPTETRSC